MLASKITKRVQIPHEPGEWLDIRALGGKKLQEARDERSRRQLATIREMGGDVLKALQGATTEADVPEQEPDPLAAYDVSTLLYVGIRAWSYDARPTPANIDELDEQTRLWAAKEILALSVETEGERRLG